MIDLVRGKGKRAGDARKAALAGVPSALKTAPKGAGKPAEPVAAKKPATPLPIEPSSRPKTPPSRAAAPDFASARADIRSASPAAKKPPAAAILAEPPPARAKFQPSAVPAAAITSPAPADAVVPPPAVTENAQKPAAASPPPTKVEAPSPPATAIPADPPPPTKTEAPPPPAPDKAAKPAAGPRETPLPDFEKLSRNVARFVQESGKAMAAMWKPVETGTATPQVGPSPELADVFATLGRVAEYYATDARRALEAQTALSTKFFALWGSTLKKLAGEKAPDVVAPEASDKRFADPEWTQNPYFDFIKQAYVLTSQWADDLVKHADELDPHTREKAGFYLRQVTSALAPTNFLATNPELLRTTVAESGENLVRGMKMMAEDIAAGQGQLRIRQADAAKFTLGVNLAATPGKVVFRNELIELIQYAPSTPTVYKRPLLIVPPWINKFYVLDLNPEKSFIRWAVAQGLTVFVVSWVNPDERHVDKGFEAYMREGVFAALEAIEAATGESDIAATGYCVGGTLLAVTLAFMAEIGDKRISSATFFTTQVDFTDAGDLKIFVDAEQLRLTEKRMAEHGYLDGAQMANAFNMLRPNDLIWSYWVNNYLKGKEPMAFDLLVWNADSTRMPAANHRFYLRHCYLQNDLTHDRMLIEGRTVSLRKVTIPVYDLAAREDHIAPARSVFTGAKFFGGPVRYVMSGSGHIAGVVNPADKPKYQYWTNGAPEGRFEDWVAAAKETRGSWWVDWIAWITAQAPERVAAREVGAGKLKPICDAPGEYVKVKS